MNSEIQKYDFLFLKRVYHCTCLRQAIEECLDNGEESFLDIVCYLNHFDHKNGLLLRRIFSSIVGQNKEHCLFVCEALLRNVILGIRDFKCTASENDEETVCVDYHGKKEFYCPGCVRRYMELMYNCFFCSFLIFSFYRKEKNKKFIFYDLFRY